METATPVTKQLPSSKERKQVLRKGLVLVGFLCFIGWVQDDLRVTGIWWLIAAAILIAILGKHYSRQWSNSLLKVSFLLMGLMAAGEIGYLIGSGVQKFSSQLFLAYIFLTYLTYRSFGKDVWTIFAGVQDAADLDEPTPREELESAAFWCGAITAVLLFLFTFFFDYHISLLIFPGLFLAGGVGLWFRQEWARRFLDALIFPVLLVSGICLNLAYPDSYKLVALLGASIAFVFFRLALWKDGVVQECRRTDAMQGTSIKWQRLNESLGVLLIGALAGFILQFFAIVKPI